MEKLIFGGHRYGKETEQLKDFIHSVRSKKKSIIIGMEYVVMSRHIYDGLMEKTRNLDYIFFEEEPCKPKT